jgi:hypothetical protein
LAFSAARFAFRQAVLTEPLVNDESVTEAISR